MFKFIFFLALAFVLCDFTDGLMGLTPHRRGSRHYRRQNGGSPGNGVGQGVGYPKSWEGNRGQYLKDNVFPKDGKDVDGGNVGKVNEGKGEHPVIEYNKLNPDYGKIMKLYVSKLTL